MPRRTNSRKERPAASAPAPHGANRHSQRHPLQQQRHAQHCRCNIKGSKRARGRIRALFQFRLPGNWSARCARTWSRIPSPQHCHAQRPCGRQTADVRAPCSGEDTTPSRSRQNSSMRGSPTLATRMPCSFRINVVLVQACSGFMLQSKWEAGAQKPSSSSFGSPELIRRAQSTYLNQNQTPHPHPIHDPNPCRASAHLRHSSRRARRASRPRGR